MEVCTNYFIGANDGRGVGDNRRLLNMDRAIWRYIEGIVFWPWWRSGR
jgi:hypothetical protein